MDNKDKSKLESLYESVLIKEQYHIHDLPFDQQVAINTLIDNGFKISGYTTQNGQRILKLRKLGIDASVDHEGFVNDESVDEFLKTFTPSTTEQPLRGLTNREVERDIAAQKAQRGEDGYAERRHEHGALHGDNAYNEYRESLKIPHGIQAINESNVVKAKVVRKPETDEFVVKVYINGKYDEEASYYTNDKADAFATKYSILRNYKDHGYTIEESKKVNPWAVEKSIEKKTGKTFGKKHKEEIVKGIKKSAKKAGKKITSKSVKKKVVKESYREDETEIVYLGDKEYLVCFSSELNNAVQYIFDYEDYGLITNGQEDHIALYSCNRDGGDGRRPERIKNPKLVNFVKRIQNQIDNQTK